MAHMLENVLPAVAACSLVPRAHALTTLVMPIREKGKPTLSPWALMVVQAFKELCPTLRFVEDTLANMMCYERAALEYR